jgi:hypothetical protein
MALDLNVDQVLQLRLRAQRLLPRLGGGGAVERVVRDLCGVQAQLPASASLAIRARSKDSTAADVQRALVEERTILRTWGMRGTLHLLATEDAGWLIPLLGPVFIAGSSRRYAQLGLDEDKLERGVRAIIAILAEQAPLTRDQLVEQLRRKGIQLEGQARPHLIAHAALKGLICHGPDQGKELTYVLLKDWVKLGNPLPEEEARAELARRYLAAYAPATPRDAAAWSGLPLSWIRSAWGRIATELAEVEVQGMGTAPTLRLGHAVMLKERLPDVEEAIKGEPVVRLLPAFDTYLLGYQDRGFALEPEHAQQVNAGGGMLHPTVLVNGRIAGTWKSTQKKSAVEITLRPFEAFESGVLAGIEAEAADVARYLGSRAGLIVEESRK